MIVKIKGRGNEVSLIRMLAWIELCGNIGHSADLKVMIDRDGITQFKFEFQDKEMQKAYEECKKNLLEYHNKEHKDLERIDLG